MLSSHQFTFRYRASLIKRAYQNWIKPSENILDIGCGTGLVSDYFKNIFRCKVTVCDIKNYLVVDMPIKIMPNDHTLPFADKQFDIAMLNDVLHHMNYDTQILILKEAIRVAKKVIVFEAKPTLSAFVFDYMLNRLHYSSLNIPLSFRGKAEWEMIFRKQGWKSKFKKSPTSFFYPFSHIAFLITYK